MLIIGPGKFKFKVIAGLQHNESASITTPEKALAEVYHNKELIDIVYVVSGGTHTWWSTNPLIREPKVGDIVEIILKGPCAMRIDWPFERL